MAREWKRIGVLMGLVAVSILMGVTPALAVYRSIDAEYASIDADDWELHDNGYTYLAVTKGDPQAPWLSPSQHYQGSKAVGYDIYPTSGVADDGQTMDKINHRIIAGNETGALGFGSARYTVFALKLSDDHFETPSDGPFILTQWWQGSPHNPPLSLEVIPDSDPVEFAFYCKDDETGTLPAKTRRMIFQGTFSSGWNFFVVKTTMSYIGYGQLGEIKVWHDGKLLSSLVNSGSAYEGYCGYKPASLGGATGVNNKFDIFIGIYRVRQMKRTQVFYDSVVFTDSYTPTQTSVEAERFSEDTCGFVMEAESSSDINSPMTTGGGGGSWGGQYLWVPEGQGNDNGDALYYLDVPDAGYYYLWVMGYAPSGSSDSIYYKFDSASSTQFNFYQGSWRWQRADDPVYLSSGNHTLTIENREDGTKVDHIHVGAYDQSPPVQRDFMVAEAENGYLVSPLAVTADAGASAGYALVSPNGTGNDNGGYVRYNVELTEAGTYYVWALVYAPTGADNSFYIKTEGGTYATWSLPVDDTDWQWVRYGTGFNLSAGGNSIYLKVREDGTWVDQIMLLP